MFLGYNYQKRCEIVLILYSINLLVWHSSSFYCIKKILIPFWKISYKTFCLSLNYVNYFNQGDFFFLPSLFIFEPSFTSVPILYSATFLVFSMKLHSIFYFVLKHHLYRQGKQHNFSQRHKVYLLSFNALCTDTDFH